MKGRKCSVAALAVATVVDKGRRTNALKSKTPHVHSIFCTAHAMFHRRDSPLSAILAARAFTMASVTTRRLPSCFNYLYQHPKMKALGCNKDNVVE